MLEANKKHIAPKSYSLIIIDSVNQILKKEKVTQTRNLNLLTRITDRKIPSVYTHVYHVIKNRGPGPYNSLRHAGNRKYFLGLCLTRNRRKADMLYLAREVGKIWRSSCWEKRNFIMINEFRYGQTLKIWPSPLSLSLYSTSKELRRVCKIEGDVELFFSIICFATEIYFHGSNNLFIAL